jgi:hypothetical protein
MTREARLSRPDINQLPHLSTVTSPRLPPRLPPLLLLLDVVFDIASLIRRIAHHAGRHQADAHEAWAHGSQQHPRQRSGFSSLGKEGKTRNRH